MKKTRMTVETTYAYFIGFICWARDNHIPVLENYNYVPIARLDMFRGSKRTAREYDDYRTIHIDAATDVFQILIREQDADLITLRL